VDGQFRVEVRSEGRSALIVVGGELDLASGPALEDELARVLASRVELVVLDLRELEFMDSTGLGILVKANRRAIDEGRRFGLVKGSPQVQRLLDLTGVAERITLVDTPEELLDSDS
jgi:anti-anti-sigma factor